MDYDLAQSAKMTAPQLSPVQSSPMDMALSNLHSRTESLLNLVHKLANVLEPIRVMGPPSDDMKANAAPTAPMSAIEASVDSVSSKLGSATYTLEAILSSLRV